VPGDGQWFRSCGLEDAHLATIIANIFELEARIAAKEGMTEHTASQLEALISDLLEYFTGRSKRQALINEFVQECVTLWSASVTQKSATNLQACATCFLDFAKSRGTRVRDFTTDFLRAYFEHLNSSNIARSLVIMHRSFAKRVVKRAKETGQLHEDPLAGLKVRCKKKPVTNVKEHGFTNPELEAIYAYLDKEIESNERI
jgi:hypothetical protein